MLDNTNTLPPPPLQPTPSKKVHWRKMLQWEWVETKKMFGTRRFYFTMFWLLIGCTMNALAVNAVALPNHFYAAGISGWSLIGYSLFGWPSVAVYYFLFNIPIFILGWRAYALKYALLSLFGVIISTVALELTTGIHLPPVEPIIASIIGGVLNGAGTALYMRMGASSGGLDMLSAYGRKRWGVPVSTTFNVINLVNLVGALLILGLQNAIYTGLMMWVTAWTLQKVLTGFSQRRAVQIFTRYPEQVAEQVLSRLHRGTTFFDARGGYSGEPIKIVYSIITLTELGKLKDLLFDVDEQAFLVVLALDEAIGGQFMPWEAEGYSRPKEL